MNKSITKLIPHKNTLTLHKEGKKILIVQGQVPPLHVERWTKGNTSPDFDRVLLSIDPGAKAGLVVLGLRLWKGSTVDLLCAIQRQQEYFELKNAALELSSEYKVTDIICENSSSGDPLYAELSQLLTTRMPLVTPTTSKYTRAVRVSAFADAHLCVTPEVEEQSLQQFSLFPASAENDVTDALTQGLELAAKILGIKLPNILISETVFRVEGVGYVVKAARNAWWAVDKTGNRLASEQTRDAAVSALLARCPVDMPGRLREARRRSGLTLRALADKCDMKCHQTIAYIEKAEQTASLEQISALAAALGVAPGWLAFGEEAKEK